MSSPLPQSQTSTLRPKSQGSPGEDKGPMKREASDTSESPAPAFIITQPSNDVAAEILPPEQDASPSDHKRPWKRWCLVAAVLALVISIPVGWTLRVHDLNIPGPTISTQLNLSANLVSVDPTGQTMIVDWKVDYACGAGGNTCFDVDIFFDQNLLQIPQVGGFQPATDNVPTSPVFRINGTVGNNESLAALANSPFFRTQLRLFSAATFGSQERTLQAYPFDKYQAKIFIFAISSNTSGIFPITLSRVYGIAPGFRVSPEPNSDNNGGVSLLLSVTRGAVVRVYSMTIIVAIWLVTLLQLATTVSSVILGRRIAKEVLLIPVTTLFAFTQLRGTLPAAPVGFGATIDFVGILPCLAILTFCTVLMLGVFLFRSPDMPGPPIWSVVVAPKRKDRRKASSHV